MGMRVPRANEQTSQAENNVFVPVPEELYFELHSALRKRFSLHNATVQRLIVDLCEQYLDRNEDVLGPRGSTGGVTWGPLFLPSGTSIMMEYEGVQNFARVEGDEIVYGNERLPSPSRLASRIANNTSRNAWRDLWIKRPHDQTFVPADSLRSNAKR